MSKGFSLFLFFHVRYLSLVQCLKAWDSAGKAVHKDACNSYQVVLYWLLLEYINDHLRMRAMYLASHSFFERKV